MFEQVPTEYASTGFTGADYGSRVRILMRSPTHVMFVALGVHIIPRGNKIGYHDTKRVCEKANRLQLSTPTVRAKIVHYFGEGSDDAAIKAATTRGQGTVLVEGGGTALPLPRQQQRVIFEQEYDAASPTSHDLIAVDKHCLQCQKALRPLLDQHRFPGRPLDDQAKTLADVRRLTNSPVMSIHGYGSNSPREWWPFIEYFTTWDGESYEQDTFCSDRCAATYGRRAAQELPHLEAGGEAKKADRRRRDYTPHYDVEAEEARTRREIEESFAKFRNRKIT